MARMKNMDYLDWAYEEGKKDWIGTILNAIIIIGSLILSYILILKILDHSPIIETVIGVAAVVIVSGIVYFYKEFGTFKEFVQTSKNSFKNIKEDMKEMKKDVKDVKKELTEFKMETSNALSDIKADVKILKSNMS